MNRHITGEDIFEVISLLDEHGKHMAWKLKFRSGQGVLDEQFKSIATAEWEADRWVRKNPDHRLVNDAIFERDILENEEVASHEGFDPSSGD